LAASFGVESYEIKCTNCNSRIPIHHSFVNTEMEKKILVRAEASTWSFFTNHAHVLLCLAADPEMRLRDVVTAVGITERAVQKIISELEAGGVLERERIGRRNVYRLHGELPLRHPVESHCTVQGLIGFILGAKNK
jgi:predicted DNA-binding transcriptional regulator